MYAGLQTRSLIPGRTGLLPPVYWLSWPSALTAFRGRHLSLFPNNFADIVSLAQMKTAASLSLRIKTFLDFCRIEKGLARNSVEAYRQDLDRFAAHFGDRSEIPGLDELRSYTQGLYEAGLAARSISRHITTLRNLYKFLAGEGVIEADPTE